MPCRPPKDARPSRKPCHYLQTSKRVDKVNNRAQDRSKESISKSREERREAAKKSRQQACQEADKNGK